MADNMPPTNGEEARSEAHRAREDAMRARDHLRAAGAAAADHLRENASAAAGAARERARRTGEWARARISDLQDRVEGAPKSSALVALGIGLVVGVALSSLIRSSRD
jgi:hypothetical protein